MSASSTDLLSAYYAQVPHPELKPHTCAGCGVEHLNVAVSLPMCPRCFDNFVGGEPEE